MNDPIQNPTAEVRDGILIIREHRPEPCMRCSRPAVGEDYARLCPACAELMGTVLHKACYDVWWFTIGLKSGGQVTFESIRSINGDWLMLDGVTTEPGHCTDKATRFPQEPTRGLQVRLDDIAWAFDWDS